MIARCLAVLAVVAQINASGCVQPSIVLSTSQSSPVTFVASGSSGGSSFGGSPVVFVSSSESSGSGSSDGGVLARNVVARGKYPVAMRSCGPVAQRQIPVTTSSSTAPVQVRPVVRLSSNVPAPRTISHSCTCYKTIVRPRVHQHIVTVPTVERYLETSHKPVVENIQYEAVPLNCQRSPSSGSGFQLLSLESGPGSSSGSSAQLISLVPGSPSGSQVIEIPSRPQQFRTVEIPQVQTFQALASDCY